MNGGGAQQHLSGNVTVSADQGQEGHDTQTGCGQGMGAADGSVNGQKKPWQPIDRQTGGKPLPKDKKSRQRVTRRRRSPAKNRPAMPSGKKNTFPCLPPARRRVEPRQGFPVISQDIPEAEKAKISARQRGRPRIDRGPTRENGPDGSPKRQIAARVRTDKPGRTRSCCAAPSRTFPQFVECKRPLGREYPKGGGF